MADRRRIKEPEMDINAITTRVDDAADVAKLPKEERANALKSFYDADSQTRAKELLMIDIVLKHMSDAKTLPTHTKTRQKIFLEYSNITGNDRTNALRMFNKIQPLIKQYSNLGMMTHHAAAVAQDVIGRIHTDLDRLQEQELKIVREIEDLDPNVEDQNKAIFRLEGRLNKIISMKNKAYERLMEYSKNFGIDLSIKTHQNVINEKKVEVLQQKFNNDASWQAGDLALRHKDLDYDEKRKLLKQMINANKGMSELIEADFEVKEVDDE